MIQIVVMMTMIATNCSSTRSRISFCEVLGEPPRIMLTRPSSSTMATAPIAMGPDRFFDGLRFDPDRIPEYLERFAISSLRVRIDELAARSFSAAERIRVEALDRINSGAR